MTLWLLWQKPSSGWGITKAIKCPASVSCHRPVVSVYISPLNAHNPLTGEIFGNVKCFKTRMPFVDPLQLWSAWFPQMAAFSTNFLLLYIMCQVQFTSFIICLQPCHVKSKCVQSINYDNIYKMMYIYYIQSIKYKFFITDCYKLDIFLMFKNEILSGFVL